MSRKNPQPHGPYLKLSYNVGGSHGIVHVKDKDRAMVERMTSNYREAREIVTRMALLGVDALKTGGLESLPHPAPPPTPSAKSEAPTAALDSARRKLESSRDKWKAKAMERHAELEAGRIKARDLTASRTKWREEALSARRAIADAKEKTVKLEKELEAIKKKSGLPAPRLPRPLRKQSATPTR